MSTQDDQPTTVQRQATTEQPSVGTAPESSRTRLWGRRVPQHIGRARSSTVLIAVLFVVLFGVYLAFPADPYVDVELPNGQVVPVRSSQLESTPTPTETPPPPSSEAPDPTSSVPPREDTGTGEDESPADPTPTTTPRTSRAPAPSTGTTGPTTTAESPTTGPEQGTDEEPTGATPTG
ncbi:hypothetical protein [Modestobacter sp. SYSU DS0875]